MSEQHAERDLVLLVYAVDTVRVDLLLADFGGILLDSLGIVETDLALLDELKQANGGDELCAGGNPEEGIFVDGLLAIDAEITCLVLDEGLSGLVNSVEGKTWCAGGAFASYCIEKLLDALYTLIRKRHLEEYEQGIGCCLGVYKLLRSGCPAEGSS